MSRTEAQKAARKKYTQKCRRLNVVIYPTETDILDKIDNVSSYTTYIKDLIRQDIKKG